MTRKVRKWRRKDFQSVRDVIWKTWVATYGSFIPEEDLRSYFNDNYNDEALQRQLEDPSIAGFLCEVDGKVVAFERTHYKKEENRFYVASLYVLPDSQGLGVGRELMRIAAKEAKKKNLQSVWLGVMVQNTQSVDWYKKLGYQIVEEQPFKMGKTTVPHFIGYLPVESLEEAAKKSSNSPARH